MGEDKYERNYFYTFTSSYFIFKIITHKLY